MKKLLKDWKSINCFGTICQERVLYDNDEPIVIVSPNNLGLYVYEIYTIEHTYSEIQWLFSGIAEKKGMALTLKSAKKKADKYLVSKGWVLLEKRPNLMLLI